jgi:hypothetical protein
MVQERESDSYLQAPKLEEIGYSTHSEAFPVDEKMIVVLKHPAWLFGQSAVSNMLLRRRFGLSDQD